MAAKTFTPALGKTICDQVRGGTAVSAAAELNRVSRAVVYQWRDKGLAGDPEYEAFALDLKAAQAEAERDITKHVVRHAEADWRAGAFWLKAHNRELYGDELTITQQVQRATEDLVDRVQPLMSEGAFNELLYALGQIMGVAGVVAREVSLGGRDAERDGDGGSPH